MPPGLNPIHVLVILVVALIVLGPHRLPEAARQVGKAMAEFRRWSESLQNEIRDVLDVELAGADEPTATGQPAIPEQPSIPAQPASAAPPPTSEPAPVPAADAERHPGEPSVHQ